MHVACDKNRSIQSSWQVDVLFAQTCVKVSTPHGSQPWRLELVGQPSSVLFGVGMIRPPGKLQMCVHLNINLQLPNLTCSITPFYGAESERASLLPCITHFGSADPCC